MIGDGAMSAGMAYEAMNNAGALKSQLLVILNDNDMSIAPPVGALSRYLARLISSRGYQGFRAFGAALAEHLPPPLQTAARAEEYARGMLSGGTLFEELGFFYVGPIDGHDIDHLLPVLENMRDTTERAGAAARGHREGPRLSAGRRVGGQAARGRKFDVATGAQAGRSPRRPPIRRSSPRP